MVPAIPGVSPRVLFVDQFTCCRTVSIDALLPKFAVVVYHDCEPEGVPRYRYCFERRLERSHSHIIYKAPVVWTGLFVRSGLAVDVVRVAVEVMRESVEFARRHDLACYRLDFRPAAPAGFPTQVVSRVISA